MSKAFLVFAKPFIDAGKNVFETMVFTKIEPQKPQLKKDNISKGDITAVMGVQGTVTKEGVNMEYKGMFVLSWPMDTYIKIAGAMLMEEYAEYTDEIADVGGEISNMVMGNAKRDLAELGYKTNMAIPSIITGEGHNITYPPDTTIILIPIVCSHGEFYMELCYKEGS